MPLRIAVIARPALGGLRRHVSLLLQSLNRTTIVPTLIAPPDFSCDPPISDVEPITLAIKARTNILTDLFTTLRLVALVRRKFDLLHAHGLRAALIAVPAARFVGIPVIWTAHNLLPSNSRLQSLLVKVLGNSASRVVAVSSAVKQTLMRCGVPSSKIVVIPNGIDTSPFESADSNGNIRSLYGIPENAPLLLAIGRFSPEKGFDVLLEAFRRVVTAHPNCNLILIGDGPEETALKTQAAGIPNTYLPGRMENIIPYYHSCDMVVVPSRLEGQGLVAIEAMASGKPVISSAVGGLVEVVLNNETGLTVPAENPQELANAIQRLIGNTGLCETMGQKGKQRVAELFTLQRMSAELEELYFATAKIGT